MTKTINLKAKEIRKAKPAQAVAVRGPVVDVTPMQMLNSALKLNPTPETLAQLLTLQERYEANVARRSFNNAIADAQLRLPVIKKNANVHYKGKDGKPDTDFWHETLAQIGEQIIPVLSPLGLSYRFRTESLAEGRIKVTCVISHRDGHSEENGLTSGPDLSGGKNAIQGVGSATTFLQRYTLKAALGLAAAKDDNGHEAGTMDFETITPEQLAEIIDRADTIGANKEKLCEHLGIDGLGLLYASRFQEAMDCLTRFNRNKQAKLAKKPIEASASAR